MTDGYEVNFDGLVGPTHNYAGLSHGNLASQRWKGTPSNPRAAALEGLRKMKVLASLGVRQAVLPPQDRPDIGLLRRLGFSGSDTQVIEKAHRADPVLLATAYSASAMWAANTATLSASPDTADGKLHLTPANLISHLHRSIEPDATAATLRAILPDDALFAHHPPLPSATHLGDEGAANHVRLAPSHGAPGLELFVYGRDAFDSSRPRPALYPARQTLQACQSIARLHGLDPRRVMFLEQNPIAVDTGVFHNDVICVGNEHVLLCHEDAFTGGRATLDAVARRFNQIHGSELVLLAASMNELPLAEAVETYLFNSQLVTLPDGSMSLIAPAECRQRATSRQFIERIVADEANPVKSVHYVDVRQSMQNGGGPACLRLRVVLTPPQLQRARRSVFLDDPLYARLTAWVERHYRERLTTADLADPKLMDESRTALDELRHLLDLA